MKKKDILIITIFTIFCIIVINNLFTDTIWMSDNNDNGESPLKKEILRIFKVPSTFVITTLGLTAITGINAYVSYKILKRIPMPPLQKFRSTLISAGCTTSLFTTSVLINSHFIKLPPKEGSVIEITEKIKEEVKKINQDKSKMVIDWINEKINWLLSNNKIYMEEGEVINNISNIDENSLYYLLLFSMMIQVICHIMLIWNILTFLIMSKIIRKIDLDLKFVDKWPIKNKERVKKIINMYINFYKKASDIWIIWVLILLLVSSLVTLFGMESLYVDSEFYMNTIRK